MRNTHAVDCMIREAIAQMRLPSGGAGFVFDLANLLAVSQSVVPYNSTGAETKNGSGVDCLSAEAIAWVIDLGVLAGGTVAFQTTIQDSNDNGVADAFANAQDFLGNAIQSASLTAGSQALILVERGNRELNANSNFRPSRRYRRAQNVTTGTYTGLPLSVHALVAKRRLPSTQTGLGN